jgi:glycosyltransferase
VSEKDCGIYDAMNKGIALCNGEIIGIVNADDFIYKETLEKVANEFLDLSIMFVYGNLDLISDDGEIFNSIESVGINTIRYKMFRQMPFLHPTMFVRTTVYKLIGLFDTAYKLSSDYDFSLRLIENNLMSKNIGCVTGVFRLGGQSGGIKTYRENHKISLIHRTNPFFVYLNTAILILKMLGRNMFSKGN